jgi:hypothetical protein
MSSSSSPTNEPGNYAYDVWLRQQWAKEDYHDGKLDTMSDYQGLVTRINALSASISVSTTTTTSPSPKPKNIAALLDLGEKMLFGRRTSISTS